MTRAIAKRSQGQFVAQWRHTGELNAQIEEAFTGHELVHGVRAAAPRSRRRSRRRTTELLRRELPVAVRLRDHHAVDDVPREPQLRRASPWSAALRVASGAMTPGRGAGVHPVLPAVHPAAHAGGVDGEPAAVRRGLGRAGVRAARRARADAGPGRAARSRRAVRAGGVRARVVPLPARRPADRRPVAGRRARADGRDRRADRRGQDHAGQPRHAVLRAGRRPDHARRRRHRDDGRARTCAPGSGWCCRTPGSSAARSATTSRYGNPDATDEQLLAAARATYVDRFVRSLPDGYDTRVDSDGGASARGRSS